MNFVHFIPLTIIINIISYIRTFDEVLHTLMLRLLQWLSCRGKTILVLEFIIFHQHYYCKDYVRLTVTASPNIMSSIVEFMQILSLQRLLEMHDLLTLVHSSYYIFRTQNKYEKESE